MKKRFFQQGDVLFVKVDEIPESKKKNDNIVAEGEVTGHMHRVLGEDTKVMVDSEGNLFVDAPSGTEVTHDEHGSIDVEPGQYEIRIVKEYDHLEQEVRDVQD